METTSKNIEELNQEEKVVELNKENQKNNKKQDYKRKYPQREHLTYYRKYKLNKDVSIRYFYVFDDRKDLEKQWVLKSHSTKKLIKLNKEQAQQMLDIFKVNQYIEIRGKYIGDGKYEKLIIKSNGKIKRFIEKEQKNS